MPSHLNMATNYQQQLQATLETVSSCASELLEYLKSHPVSHVETRGLPSDPFDSAPKAIKIARKKFTEASSSLVELGTRPEEYLEHLQNGVSEISSRLERSMADMQLLPVSKFDLHTMAR